MREGFWIGPLFVHYYGILIMLGALAAAWLADREARRRGLNGEVVWDSLPWLLIAGIVGARLWHLIFPPASSIERGQTFLYYLTHPIDAISTWNGGLGIPGAVIGGLLALYFYTRRHKLSFLTWIDIIAPGLALAQAIGRWGNFINQELYGAPTSLPWAIFIEPAYRLSGFENQAYFHPLFLYESLWNLATAGFLLWVGRRFAGCLRAGDIFLLYLVAYPTARFFLEFLRLDVAVVGSINANQASMALIAVASILTLLFRRRQPEKPAEDEMPAGE